MEFFDICDERGLPTGEVVERSVAHSKGILHRTAHVWIIKKVDGRWQVLLQKRSKDKDSYPGQFDTSRILIRGSLILRRRGIFQRGGSRWSLHAGSFGRSWGFLPVRSSCGLSERSGRSMKKSFTMSLFGIMR